MSKSSNPYLDFQRLQDPTKKRNLELVDVQKIYNYCGKYQMARDLFIFQVFCIGIDIVDICYLTEANIDKGRIEIRYYGKSKPISNNDTLIGRRKNRRVEFIILEK